MFGVMKFRLLGIALASTSIDAASPIDSQTRWAIQTARIHGAASSVSNAAAAVQKAALSVDESGRLHGLARIHDSIEELNRQVGSASLACQVLSHPPRTQQ